MMPTATNTLDRAAVLQRLRLIVDPEIGLDIVTLGLGDSTGYSKRITVAEAVAQLRSPYGDRYFTVSPTTV